MLTEVFMVQTKIIILLTMVKLLQRILSSNFVGKSTKG